MRRSDPSIAQAIRDGAREAFGVPAAVMIAGFIGYGALAADSGFSLWATTLSTVLVWALPGQLVLQDMYAVDAASLVIVIAVSLTAVRFLPMAITLMPLVRDARASRWRLYLAAHFVSMTSWAVCMGRCAGMPRQARVPYLVAFSVTCWSCCLAAGVVGYFAGGLLPAVARLGCVFLTPVYFLCLLVGDARTPLAMYALASGAIAGPVFHLLDPEWGLLLAGLIGGSIAYVLQRATRGVHA
jgi:predicted branched-subunit amino acid permease